MSCDMVGLSLSSEEISARIDAAFPDLGLKSPADDLPAAAAAGWVGVRAFIPSERCEISTDYLSQEGRDKIGIRPVHKMRDELID